MNILNLNQFQIIAFLLVFLRCTGFFVSWPIFGGNNVPVHIKVLLSLLVGMVCFTLIKPENYPVVESYTMMVGLAVKEIAVGVAMGYLGHLLFYAVTIAGELISMSMGLSSSQVFNPAFGFQQSSVNQLYFFMAAFIFLVMQGHHYFISGVYESFKLIPLDMVLPDITGINSIVVIGGTVLKVGLMLSAPVMVAILLVNFSLGIVGRAVPQINVLITSLPINALVGFVILIIVLPFFLEGVQEHFYEFSDVMFGFMKSF